MEGEQIFTDPANMLIDKTKCLKLVFDNVFIACLLTNFLWLDVFYFHFYTADFKLKKR